MPEINHKPYLLTEVEEEDFLSLADDPEWAFEQKVDGTRAIAHYLDGEVTWYSRAGKVLKHTAATQHLTALSTEIAERADRAGILEVILDGEVMIGDGIYWVFDLQKMAGLSFSGGQVMKWGMRQLILRAWLKGASGNMRLLPSVTSPNKKRRLFEAVKEGGGEGVVAKRMISPYIEGRTKEYVKFKFVKTADVVVTEVNRPSPKLGNISFGVFEDGELTNLGTCSAIGKPEVHPGEVIEVAYLYRADTGGLIQPRMMRVRTDKAPEECTPEQFPKYSREVIKGI